VAPFLNEREIRPAFMVFVKFDHLAKIEIHLSCVPGTTSTILVGFPVTKL